MPATATRYTRKHLADLVHNQLKINGGDTGAAAQAVVERICRNEEEAVKWFRYLGPILAREIHRQVYKSGSRSTGSSTSDDGSGSTETTTPTFTGPSTTPGTSVFESDEADDPMMPVDQHSDWVPFSEYTAEHARKRAAWFRRRVSSYREKANKYETLADALGDQKLGEVFDNLPDGLQEFVRNEAQK